MIIYHNDCTEPYENMATEEYLLDSAGEEDIFMLWRNEPAVIIGRNQNAYAEINLETAEKKNIKVVRRLTGGGAVFHDLGNLNYTFISSDIENGTLNFARFCDPIIAALRELGLNAEMSGRNDITVDGFKVSGTAQCVRNGHIMHHGTLLWSADLSDMADVLRPDETKLASKGIKSVQSRVGNISSLLKNANGGGISDSAENTKMNSDPVNVETNSEGANTKILPESADDFRGYLESRFGGNISFFTDEQRAEIRRLADEKYSSWDWIFGKSKEYTQRKKARFAYGLVEISVTLDRGIINEISIQGDFFGSKPINELEEKLCGVRFVREEIIKGLSDVGSYIYGAVPGDIEQLIIG